jgi:branched-chain amino acid aminotransferase
LPAGICLRSHNGALSMKNYFNHNGKLFEVSDPALSICNHSYRYGDGLFETMKMVNGKINLIDFHFERLFYSMQVLGFRVPVLFSEKEITNQINQLAEKNNCSKLARIRLAVSRGEGGVNDCDDKLQYTIECFAADENINRLNENGFTVDIFPGAIKSCDKFSNLKSSSYLHYVMAARFAKENKLNDALVLNQHNRICEASIANLFWIKDKIVYTSPLSEGCVAGTMRKYLLKNIPFIDIIVLEADCNIEDLMNADEVFLTNAVYGIRWVKQLGNKQYACNLISSIYKLLMAPLNK